MAPDGSPSASSAGRASKAPGDVSSSFLPTALRRLRRCRCRFRSGRRLGGGTRRGFHGGRGAGGGFRSPRSRGSRADGARRGGSTWSKTFQALTGLHLGRAFDLDIGSGLHPGLDAERARLHGQFVGRQLEGTFRHLRRDATHLEEDAARLDDRHPAFGRALAAAHSGFGRLLRDLLIGKDPDEHLAAPAHKPSHHPAGGFDLPVRHPGGFGGLQAELAKGQVVALGGHPGTAAPVDLSILDAGWKQHPYSFFFGARARGVFGTVVFSPAVVVFARVVRLGFSPPSAVVVAFGVRVRFGLAAGASVAGPAVTGGATGSGAAGAATVCWTSSASGVGASARAAPTRTPLSTRSSTAARGFRRAPGREVPG